MPEPKQISVTDYADQNNLTVIEIYAMIDAKKIKSIKKDKKTMILV